MFAGVPVIASEWENVNEIIEYGENGVIYKFNDLCDFKEKLILMENTGYVNKMKKKCLSSAIKYQKETAIKNLIDVLGQ